MTLLVGNNDASPPNVELLGSGGMAGCEFVAAATGLAWNAYVNTVTTTRPTRVVVYDSGNVLLGISAEANTVDGLTEYEFTAPVPIVAGRTYILMLFLTDGQFCNVRLTAGGEFGYVSDDNVTYPTPQNPLSTDGGVSGTLVIYLDGDTSAVVPLGVETATRNSNGGMSFTIPAECTALVIGMVGYIGFPNNNTLAVVASFDEEGAIDGEQIAFANYPTNNRQVDGYVLTAADPLWPGTGPVTFYIESRGGFSEGFRTTLRYYAGVDQADPLVGAEGYDWTDSNITSDVAGAGPNDLGVAIAYEYVTPFTNGHLDDNGQTVVLAAAAFGNACMGWAEKYGTGALTVNETGPPDGSSLSMIAFILRAAADDNVELDIADATHGHTAESLALTQANTLAIADAAHAHAAESLALVQESLLAIADALHGHTADGVLLVQEQLLAIADALHAHTAETVALVQANLLTIADTLHGHAAESPALIQANALAIADATHGHTAQSVTLSPSTMLSIFDALHGHTADSPTLLQANVLAIADALHGHTAESITLSSATLLSIADALHAHLAENLALVQGNVVAINDARHVHTAENVALAQAGTLVVFDATHAHTADSVTLTESILLAIADTLHGHTADSPQLILSNVLAISRAVHAHFADSPALTQAAILVISDALHAHFADQISLRTGLGEVGTVFVIEAVDRLFVVAPVSSIFTVGS